MSARSSRACTSPLPAEASALHSNPSLAHTVEVRRPEKNWKQSPQKSIARQKTQLVQTHMHVPFRTDTAHIRWRLTLIMHTAPETSRKARLAAEKATSLSVCKRGWCRPSCLRESMDELTEWQQTLLRCSTRDSCSAWCTSRQGCGVMDRTNFCVFSIVKFKVHAAAGGGERHLLADAKNENLLPVAIMAMITAPSCLSVDDSHCCQDSRGGHQLPGLVLGHKDPGRAHD